MWYIIGALILLIIGVGTAIELVDLFIDTEFEGGRHARRVGLITEIEENN